jgi:hypothetical protein
MCTKVHWFLCAEEGWRLENGLSNKEKFFCLIVGLLEADPDNDWAKDTLQWWDS